MPWVLLAALAAAAASTAAAMVLPSPPHQPPPPHVGTRLSPPCPPGGHPTDSVPGSFIVKFRDSAVVHGKRAIDVARALLGASAASRIRGHRSFVSAAFRSLLVVDTSGVTAAALQASPLVESVTPDFLVYPAAVSMAPLAAGDVPPARGPALRGGGGRRLPAAFRSGWNVGLDRLDQRDGPVDGAFSYFTSAAYTLDGGGVDVYVMDSGIRADHDEFGGRVDLSLGRNFVSDAQGWGSANATDSCLGHGTFVASQIGGSAVGVAPGVRLIPLRVFSCASAGAYSSLLAATDYVIATAAATGRRSIVNFSGTAPSTAQYDTLSDRLLAAGVPLVASAGNEGVPACSRSPGRAASAFTVGASNASDAWASFSNYGPCVNLTAVGVDSIGAWYTAPDGYAQGSGTSFATPIVAGLAATVWGALPAGTPWSTVTSVLTASATAGKLTSLPAGTPNLLAYNGPNGGLAELMATFTPAPSVTLSPGTQPSAQATPSGSTTPSRAATTTASRSRSKPAATASPTRTRSRRASASRTRARKGK